MRILSREEGCVSPCASTDGAEYASAVLSLL
jgi:hypothetical protein